MYFVDYLLTIIYNITKISREDKSTTTKRGIYYEAERSNQQDE